MDNSGFEVVSKNVLVSSKMHDKVVSNILDKAFAQDVNELKNYLQENHFSIDHQNSDGSTALYVAAKNGYLRPMTTLIAAGADVNISTPVLISAERCQLSCLQALIKAGARLDELDEEVALLLAPNVEYFQSLIKDEACVSPITQEGVPLLARVSGRGEEDHALLESGTVVDNTDHSGITALMNASEVGNSDIVKMLLKAKADPNKQDNNGITALMYACTGKNRYYWVEDKRREAVQTLLEAGADVNITDNSGHTALMMAVKYWNSDIVNLLLKAGTDVNITDQSGRTALMISAEYWKYDFIKELLLFKADPNKQDRDGKTALMYARNAYCIKVLISHGANVNLMDKSECRALDFSLQNQASECHEIWDSRECRIEMPDNCSVFVLLKAGSYPVINAKYRHYFEKLFLSDKVKEHLLFLSDIYTFKYDCKITKDHKQLIRFFVCNGIMGPYSTRDTTVIQRALKNNQVDVLKYLIANCYLKQKDLELLINAFSQPWPLVKLAFITVSSALGPNPGREERITKTGLPGIFQRMLLFQGPVSRLPVSEWKDIPLWFDQ